MLEVYDNYVQEQKRDGLVYCAYRITRYYRPPPPIMIALHNCNGFPVDDVDFRRF